MQTENKDSDERFIRVLKPNAINNNKHIEPRPRSSGFKSFLNWFKKIEISQKFTGDHDIDTPTDSSLSDEEDDSDISTSSTATVESFAFLPANIYKPYGDASQPEKYITPGPYTDTYHRLIKERNKRRHLDKNLSLRKKYSLYSSGTINSKVDHPSHDTRSFKQIESEEVKVYNTFSLPAIAKQGSENVNSNARKTASLSTKGNKTPYHVKGKRKAPPPPINIETIKTHRKKRQAPTPPCLTEIQNTDNTITAVSNTTKIINDYNQDVVINTSLNMPNFKCDASPKPWFKRQSSENKVKQKPDTKKKGRHEFPEVVFFRCSRIFETKKQNENVEDKNEKRISCFLPNISELDREAAEIIKHKKELEDQTSSASAANSNISKPSSTKDLINKFNALTNHISKQPNLDKDDKCINKSPVTIITRKYTNKANDDVSISHDNINVEVIKNTNISVNESAGKCTMCVKGKIKIHNICSDCMNDNISDINTQLPKNPSCLKIDSSTSFQAEVFSALPNFKYPITKGIASDDLKLDNCAPTTNDVDEKIRLKEMLKEMKNSLPKRHKPIKKEVQPDDILVAHSNQTDDESNKEKVINKTKSIFNTNQINNIADKYKGKLPEFKNKEHLSRIQLSEIKVEQSLRSREVNKVSSSAQTNCSVKNTEQIIESEKKVQSGNKNNLNNNENTGNKDSTQMDLYINIPNSEITKTDVTETVKQINCNIKVVLKQLEAAIADGNHMLASKLAKELALLKVKCSVTTSNLKKAYHNAYKCVQIYIEDQFSHQGPISIKVEEDITIKDLKKRVFDDFNIPIGVQKWIINKQLTVNEERTLKHYNEGNFDEALFLYVVSPDNKKENVLATEILIPPDRDAKSTNEFKENIIINGKISSCSVLSPSNNIAAPLCTKRKTVNVALPSTSKSIDPLASVTLGMMHNVTKKTWDCSECTLINSLLSPICSACGTRKSDSPQTSNYPTTTSATISTSTIATTEKGNDHYLQLLNLDNSELVANKEEFECSICFTNCERNAGVVLRDCLHSFCKECLANVVKYSEDVEIKCPYRDKFYFCDSVLQEREIKALVNKSVYEKHLAKSVTIAENKIQNAFHCKTPNCKGWCIFEENVNIFNCPICKKKNCLTCQVIHDGKNCKEYQQTLNNADGNSSGEIQRTKKMLEEIVSRGEAMACPCCQVVLMKKWGCDWVKCSMCKTEICWVTRGARWGPAGKGDTSAGCQCGVNGVKCHPKCNYCH